MTTFHKDGDRMGIMTDAESESDFINQASEAIAKLIESKEFEGDWEFQLNYWLRCVADICCQYRGYSLIPRVIYYSGNKMPSQPIKASSAN